MSTVNRPTAEGVESIRELNPEQVLRYGYCLHVADDPFVKGTLRADAAAEKAKRFMALRAVLHTPEEIYLEAAHTTAISYAGAIGNLKRALFRELDATTEERVQVEKKMRGNRGWSIVSSGLARYLMQIGMAGIIFGIGFSLAHTIAPFIPDKFAEGSGSQAPSFLSGLVLVVLARWGSAVWDDRRRNRIAEHFAARWESAWDLYGEMRVRTYRHHYSDLLEAWKQFTGSDYATHSVLDDVLQDDLDLRRAHNRKAKELSRSSFLPLRQVIEFWRRWRAEKREAEPEP
ncbi:MAG: hypothetical protein U1E56_07185 [Bauldia sp.]